MQLAIEHVQTLGVGHTPCAIHTPANVIQIIYAGENNKQIFAMNSETPYGNFGNRTFESPFRICKDSDVEFLKLKFVYSSLFVVWKNFAEPHEVVPYVYGVTHNLRHRFAVWSIRQNISKYLINGSLDLNLDDQVTRLSISFENPKYILSHEESTAIVPGTKLTLFFRSGSSKESFVMGKYYVDTNSMSIGEASTNADCRNTIGKLLKDQTFDTDNEYLLQNVKMLVEDIFARSSVKDYWISDTEELRGMLFPQDMSILDGLKELLQTMTNWMLKEDFSGKIGFGERSDSRFGVFGTYEFERDKDIFSRKVERDDTDVYSRICVHNEDYSIAEYRELEFTFVMGYKKTYHVSVPKETTIEDAKTYADNLVTLMSGMGVIETFGGPFRPYLRPGDNAKIIGKTTRVLGMITGVRHKFGKSGFSTEFTVDSGLLSNKMRVSDYINKITGNQSGGQATRLY